MKYALAAAIEVGGGPDGRGGFTAVPPVEPVHAKADVKFDSNFKNVFLMSNVGRMRFVVEDFILNHDV